MKRTGIKKLELKRLTVKQLGNAQGGYWIVKSGGSACSNTCSTCDANNQACLEWIPDPVDNGGGCGCGCGGCGGGCGGCGD